MPGFGRLYWSSEFPASHNKHRLQLQSFISSYY
jgi:hypothetical protein